jgi:hypothetical protein
MERRWLYVKVFLGFVRDEGKRVGKYVWIGALGRHGEAQPVPWTEVVMLSTLIS